MLAAMALLADPTVKTRSDLPPRKVIVGIAMQPFWVEYPGLEKRLEELTALVDRMAEESRKKYGRSLDLAVLPEMAVTGEELAHAVPLGGLLKDMFSTKARQLRSYIVVPTYLVDDAASKRYSNAAILFGRTGEVVGVYRKMHLAVHTASDSLEDGATPGKEIPVFECDFGRLGIQICFDIEFDRGWEELARKGADLVAWPTQSPQTATPAFRAKQYGYYVVSSTWRNNASIFEPTGRIVSQIKPTDKVLVQELDLSYAILPWSPTLKRDVGQALGLRRALSQALSLPGRRSRNILVERTVRRCQPGTERKSASVTKALSPPICGAGSPAQP
jgi:predicted amidohydrolase